MNSISFINCLNLTFLHFLFIYFNTVTKLQFYQNNSFANFDYSDNRVEAIILLKNWRIIYKGKRVKGLLLVRLWLISLSFLFPLLVSTSSKIVLELWLSSLSRPFFLSCLPPKCCFKKTPFMNNNSKLSVIWSIRLVE